MKAILKNLADATDAINLTVRENRTVIHDTLENVNHITLTSGPELQKILLNVRVITEDVKELLAAQGHERTSRASSATPSSGSTARARASRARSRTSTTSPAASIAVRAPSASSPRTRPSSTRCKASPRA